MFWRWFIKPFILIFQHDVNLNTKTGTKALPKTWFENLVLEFPASMLVLEVARARLSQPPSDVKIDDLSLSTDLNRGEKPLALFCFFLANTITAILCRSSSVKIRWIKMPKLMHSQIIDPTSFTSHLQSPSVGAKIKPQEPFRGAPISRKGRSERYCA